MTLHVVGAGLAGLACALTAADAGRRVVLHEATVRAGGRCRSWKEPSLDRVIDNGTHMVVGGNSAVFAFLQRTGARDQLVPGPAAFPMLDLASGALWTATPAALLPSLVASAWRTWAGHDRGIADCLGVSAHYRRFWEPLALAVMNTPAEEASVRVFRRVLARTLWRGAAASAPFLVRNSLSETFIAPAVAALAQAGVEIRMQHPLRRLAFDGSRVAALEFADDAIALEPGDCAVLAVPCAVASDLLPEIPELPMSPIVNAHYRLAAEPPIPATGRFLGLLGTTGHWLFLHGDVLSVTVSAAGRLAERSVEEIGELLWDEASRALQLREAPLARRVIKEKRATLFHSPEVEARRPAPRARDNLFLAGDWTATGLPCTIEGSIRSGVTAARLAVGT